MTFEAENSFAPESTAVGSGGESEVVSAADLLTPEAKGASEQSKEPVSADAPAENKAERMFTSGEMSDTVEKRLKQERRKAAYVLGSELLKERMNADNVDETEALRRIREDRRKAKAAEYKNDPQKAFEELLRMREQPQEPEEEDTETSEAAARRVYNDIVEGISSGRVPKEFDIKNYLSDVGRAREFITLYEKLGLEQACSIAMRMTSSASQEKTARNRALPKPIDTNNTTAPKAIDYMSMTSEQFAEYKRRVKEARAAGKTVQ